MADKSSLTPGLHVKRLQHIRASYEASKQGHAFIGHPSYDEQIAIVDALLAALTAGMEQEPIYQLRDYDWYDAEKHIYEEVVSAGGTGRIVYAAPQLPHPAVVPDAIEIDDDFDSAFEHGKAVGWNACRAAMLQGAEPVSETDNTTQQFESLGLIVTSNERKMELPHCSKHPGTELLVHPFEQLLSYPPQPVMYCPLCRPSVAKWVEFDNQLRQWKGVK